MRKLNPAIVAVAIASIFLLSSCSSAPKTAKELACEKNSAGSVELVNELAKSSSDGISPFPKLEVLENALLAKGIPGSKLTSDFYVLGEYYLEFADCLTPEGQKLIDKSKDIEFSKLF